MAVVFVGEAGALVWGKETIEVEDTEVIEDADVKLGFANVCWLPITVMV